MGEPEFESSDYNLCYPFPYINDPETFSIKQEEDAGIDNQNFMMMPEYYCPEYMGNEQTSFMPKPLDFFGNPESEGTDSKAQKLPKSSKNCSVLPFVKKVGTLSLDERKQKIYRYLEKKRRRNYAKRVGYACRKRVADSRMRIKGRFISKSESEKMRKDS